MTLFQRKILFCVIGMTLTFNWLVIPISGNSPRFSDLVGLVALVIMLRRVFTMQLTRLGLALVPISIAATYWMFAGAMGGDMSMAIFGLRLFLGLTAFVLITQLIVEWDMTAAFLWGMSLGAAIVGFIAMGQGTGMIPAMNLFIPPGTDTWWDGSGRVRAVGIWQHPNSVGQVQALGAAAALSLTFMGRKIRPLALMTFMVIVATTYLGTLNRAMILVSIIAGTVAVMGSPHRTLKTAFMVSGVFAVLLFPFIAPLILGDRWVGDSQAPSMSENGLERLQTLVFSFEMVLTRPFGHGISGSVDALMGAFGFSASHNSIVSIGLTLGLIPMAVMIALLVHGILQTSAGYQRQSAPLLAAMITMFFFEDSIFLPSVISTFFIVTLWGHKMFIPKPAGARTGPHPVASFIAAE